MSLRHALTPALTASVALSVAATTTVQAPEAAKAQAAGCGERDSFLARLKEVFSEQPVAMGMDARGHVVEILACGGVDHLGKSEDAPFRPLAPEKLPKTKKSSEPAI